MDIVLLSAGTSSRMGKTNKLLLPVNGTTMVANSAMQALEYIAKQNNGSTLIIVTGYRRFSTAKALKPCKDFIESTNAKVKMVVVYNKNYKDGQFSSVQTGVKQIEGNEPFFIALADMPHITDKHYKLLEDKLGNNDAVRAVVNNVPGHPVLLAPHMKEKILKAGKNNKVSNILRKSTVAFVTESDTSWIYDIDTQEDFSCLK